MASDISGYNNVNVVTRTGIDTDSKKSLFPGQTRSDLKIGKMVDADKPSDYDIDLG